MIITSAQSFSASPIRRLPAVIGLALAMQSVRAQDRPATADQPQQATPATTSVEAPAAGRVETNEALDGIWPSEKLMRLALIRMADRVASRYDLDDQQRQQLRDMTVERWIRFANEHRRRLQPLLNEFLEIRMDLRPPSKEQVEDWAKRAGPIFEKYRDEFHAATDEFRETLGPAQRTKLEVDALQYRIGMELVESKLKRWRRGEFKPEDLWEGPPGRRRGDPDPDARPAENEDSPGASLVDAGPPVEPKGPEDQVAVELGLWDEYVARFIREYRLDEAQRDAVLSCLAELKQRAVTHRDSRWHDIVALERKIADSAKSEAELADIKAQLIDLYGPIDTMFQELKERVQQIPTGPQRAAAAERRGDADARKVDDRAGEANEPAPPSEPPDPKS